MTRRREKPIKRVNPSGEVAWQARWTTKDGKRRFGWPPDIKGTYRLRKDAQVAIDACYEREAQGPVRPGTVGLYFESWQKVHPRSKVTDRTNRSRITAVLDLELEGAKLRDWPFDQLRRRHANLIVAALMEDGRAHTGVVNVLGSLSAMAEDAVDDEVLIANPFKGVKVRRNDPRIQTASRTVRVFSWEQMHAFARACGEAEGGSRDLQVWRPVYAEAMVRVLSDCGLRAGELLALEHRDLDLDAGVLRVERTAALGEVLQGTKTDHGEEGAGRDVPLPPGLVAILREVPPFFDSPRLFPSPKGGLWLYASWWTQVWNAGRAATGMDIRPHEMRHSWISLMRAAGVDPADVADAAGHTLQTATARYTHSLRRSMDAMRGAVGE